MKTTISALVASAAALGMVSAVQAADLVIYDPPMMETVAMATSGWDGFYLGVQGGGLFESGDIYGTVQGVVGANFSVSPMFLLGVEGAVGPYFGDDSGWNGYLAGRAGFTADSLLIYGIGGASVTDGDWGYLAGLGVEAMMSDDMSIRGQVVSYNGEYWSATVGAMWHF
ncbi:hypothetical protein [Devosia sp.]|uniref:hypothetical protein n=1 Tax=Devosia sp. TaxID=1871048 RepID=UPI003A92C699